MRLLLDTNVLIDIYDRRKPFYKGAYKLLIMQVFGDAELWASSKSFTDIFCTLSKKYRREKIYDAFEASFEWLELCPIEEDDIKLAVSEGWEDLEDCVVDIAARKINADFLITRDSKGFEKSKISAMSPAEFLAHIKDEYGLVYDDVDF